MIYTLSKPYPGKHYQRRDVHEEDPTPEEMVNMEMAITEIKFHSEDLSEFLTWCAHEEEVSEEEFAIIASAVYSFCHRANELPQVQVEES